MSFLLAARVLNTETKLTLAQKIILLGLAEHASVDGTSSWPSVKRLARYAECSERTAFSAIKHLREEGWITQAARSRQHRPAVYRVELDRLAQSESRHAKIAPLESARPEAGFSPDLQIPARSKGSNVLERVEERSPTTQDPDHNREHVSGSGVASADWLCQLWNERAGRGAPRVLQLTKTRRRAAVAAWRGHPDASWWRAALDRAHRSRFLRGAKGWKMTFDWFLKGDNALRVTEGVHDDRPGDFAAARDEARTIIRRTGGYCSHDPICSDREAHEERILDAVLGLGGEAQPNEE